MLASPGRRMKQNGFVGGLYLLPIARFGAHKGRFIENPAGQETRIAFKKLYHSAVRLCASCIP